MAITSLVSKQIELEVHDKKMTCLLDRLEVACQGQKMDGPWTEEEAHKHTYLVWNC